MQTKSKFFFFILGMSYKAVNTSENIIRIDPLKSRRIIVHFIKSFIVFIQMKQIPIPVLNISVLRFGEQEPIDLSLFRSIL